MTPASPNPARRQRTRNLRKRFGALEVLKGISLDAHEGDVISILGASGSGKSTLLRCINLLEIPDEGDDRRRRRNDRASHGPRRHRREPSTARRSTGSGCRSRWCSRTSICGRT